MSRRVAVIGYGPVGRETAARLTARGDEVRVVQRKLPPRLGGAMSFQPGDVEDAESMKQACAGADTVVCCLGLPYDSVLWAQVWPAATHNLLLGCAAAGARFILADNLYLYDPQRGRSLTEDLPLTDYGEKPRIRAQVTKLWQAAHATGSVRATAVRASDFYGPDVATSVISAFGVARLIEGKHALVPYPPDTPHDFTYVPDFARALVTLVDAPDDAYGQAWHVPHAPTRTLREVLTLAAERASVPPRFWVLPTWLQPVVGLFSKEVRELAEMHYQWDRPFLVDATKFSLRFWGDATSFEQGLDVTIDFYRRRAREQAAARRLLLGKSTGAGV